MPRSRLMVYGAPRESVPAAWTKHAKQTGPELLPGRSYADFFSIGSSHSDFDAAVLRLAHTIRRRHARVLLAMPALVDGGSWHPVTHQRRFDRIGTALGEGEVILLRAGEVGVAGDRDIRLALLESGGCRVDHLPSVRRQVGFVELEEDNEGLLAWDNGRRRRRRRRRSGDGRGGRAKLPAQAGHHRVDFQIGNHTGRVDADPAGQEGRPGMHLAEIEIFVADIDEEARSDGVSNTGARAPSKLRNGVAGDRSRYAVQRKRRAAQIVSSNADTCVDIGLEPPEYVWPHAVEVEIAVHQSDDRSDMRRACHPASSCIRAFNVQSSNAVDGDVAPEHRVKAHADAAAVHNRVAESARLRASRSAWKCR